MNRLLLTLVFCALPWILPAALPGAESSPAIEHTWLPLRAQLHGLNISALVPPTLEYSELRWTDGDDPRWAASDWDDSAWNKLKGTAIPSHRGIYWIRFHVRDLTQETPDAALLWDTLAYDFYWDGILMGRSGRPANRLEDEIPGGTDTLFTLPEIVLAKGEHVVALRVSNYRDGFPAATMPFQFSLVPAAAYQDFNRRSAILPTMAVGAMLLALLTSLVMWLVAARRPILLLFAATCLFATIMQALLVVRISYGYTYNWLYPAIVASRVSMNVLALCVIALVIVQCRLPRWCWLWVTAAAAVTWLNDWFAVLATNYVTLLLVGAVFGAGWAMWRRRRGADFIFGGVLVTTLMWLHDSTHFVNSLFLMDFLPTLFGLICAVALDLRQERRQARETQLTAARLEIELLKKNLQPHFMLNTLTAITEVIERDPVGAVQLIEDLAEEFRALARISGEKQVPLGQELDLCRAHLRVISLRTGAKWNLDTDGVDESATVPPALFLTLIENGFAHQEMGEASGTFSLRMTRLTDAVHYTFRSPGKIRETSGRTAGGTGLRYVRARLEESFPGNWKLVSAAAADGWQTVIELTQPRLSGTSP